MHRPTDPTASPIRARIHERALSRVTKLFNAGLGDIFAELFQNARRAGAGRIDVTLVAVTGSKPVENAQTICTALDHVHGKYPDMVLVYVGNDTLRYSGRRSTRQ